MVSTVELHIKPAKWVLQPVFIIASKTLEGDSVMPITHERPADFALTILSCMCPTKSYIQQNCSISPHCLCFIGYGSFYGNVD